MDNGLWFSVLGPVRAWRDEVEVELGSPQQRAVLAALLLREGARISVDDLSAVLWGGGTPAKGHAVVRTYVSRLRQSLEPGAAAGASPIRTVGGGYVLTPPEHGFDLAVFRQKVAAAEQARQAGDPSTAATLLGTALALWRGEALAGVTGAYAESRRAELEVLRLGTVATHLATQLELGRHAAVTPELTSIVDRHPLDERFREMLMLALYRSGQQADALATYQSARTLLAEELGVDPGPALQGMYERIVRADPELLVARAPGNGTAATTRTPPAMPNILAQLPPRLTVFAGRDSELARADALLAEPDAQPGAVLVSGTAGVGKTAFAVYWAHRIAHRCPDGQLYLDLRGFDPANPPMTATEAIRSLLERLGAAPASIPESLEAMTALYRGLLADRRILLVLDNARLATQVRPLLPGNTGCLVIVTSRNQLSGLLAIDGARPVTLDILTPDSARAVLARRIGERRTTAEPDAVAEIIELCARLPLALAIVAAHCATRPAFPLAAIAATLRESANHLNTFSVKESDTAADVRTVFSWSYQALTPEAKRVFRLLALHPGPDASIAAIASLAGLPQAATEEPLGELVSANLLIEHTPGRYSCHDLLRIYAHELTHRLDTPADRAAAEHRMLDHYMHLTHAAAPLFNLLRDAVDLPSPQPGVTLDVPFDEQTVLRWFSTEHHVLMAVTKYAVSHGFDLHTWQLAWAMDTPLFRAGHWRDAVAVHIDALAAAERLADPEMQARSHNFLAAAHATLHHYEDAERHNTTALAIDRSEGNLAGEAASRHNLGIIASRQARSQDAIHHFQQTLAIYQQIGDSLGQLAALTNLAYEFGIIGDHDEAVALSHEALLQWTERGDQHAQAHCRDNLAYSYHRLGDQEQATEHYQAAIDTFRELGDQINEATSLDRLGDSRHAAHDHAGAHRAWSQALAIFDSTDGIDATGIQLKLTRSASLAHAAGRNESAQHQLRPPPPTH